MRLFLLLLLLPGLAGQFLPPTGVDVAPTSENLRLPWRTGQVTVKWNTTLPLLAGAIGYKVTMVPMLNYTNTFSTAADVQDFVYTQGSRGHNNSIAWNEAAGTLDVCYAGGNLSWQDAGWGRGYAPFALRKIPDGYKLTLQSVNCSSPLEGVVSTYMCGLVVYDAGANRPLITWMVGMAQGASGYVLPGRG